MTQERGPVVRLEDTQLSPYRSLIASTGRITEVPDFGEGVYPSADEYIRQIIKSRAGYEEQRPGPTFADRAIEGAASGDYLRLPESFPTAPRPMNEDQSKPFTPDTIYEGILEFVNRLTE